MRRDEVQPSRMPVYFTFGLFWVVSLFTAYAWFALPTDARVPVHWGVDGNVDGYAGKTFGLLLLPGIMLLLLVLMIALSAFAPRRSYLSQSWKAISAIWIGLSVFLSVIHFVVIWAALGHLVDVSLVIVLGMGGLLCVTGNYMGKVRTNYFVGVRTPWTLSSEVAWNKTNRLGGKLLVATGVLAIVAGLTLGITVTLAVVMISVLATAAITVAYSYHLWKSDPDRRRSRD